MPIVSTSCTSYDRSKSYHPCRSQRTSDGWSTPQELGPPLSSPAKEIGISLAANNSIYFGSKRKGGDGKGGIWVAPFVNNTWPRAIHISVNHPASDPGIAPDESFMVFTAMNQPGGYGQRDLYLTLRFAGWHLVQTSKSGPSNQLSLF